MADTQPPGIPLGAVTVPSPAYTGGGYAAASSAAATRSPNVSGPPGPSDPSGSSASSGSSQASEPRPQASRVTPEQLRAKFRDFDDRAVYQQVVAHALTENALNFVVQFGDNKAQVAYDLTEGDFEQLLATPDQFRDAGMPIRWINIWNPSRQQGIIEAIGRRFQFSKRLTMSIWAWDMVKKELIKQKLAQREELLHPRAHAARDPSRGAAWPHAARDLENGTAAAAAGKAAALADGDGGRDAAKPAPGLNDIISDPENLATFKMMQDNLNYTSIDQEARFVCIGANWLHRRPQYKSRKPPSLVPPKHWTWFALCEDHTVLSFHEAAYYDKIPKSEDETAWKKTELKHMRSNTLKVLRQLSKCGLEEDQHKFTQLISVRQPGRNIASDALNLEGSSNLFYYLFEDYSAAFVILNSSKAALDEISGRILRTADWKNKEDTSNIIPRLYGLNKELRQLRHLFTNYKTLIDRLVSSDAEIFDEGAVKEKLSNKACNRFKRLQVQLQSLMLDAINDYLDEKTSLQDTYFSLITQKDSHSTERLTRSATLLAKLSVFFLPISFMTSYFSVQIPHMTDGYTTWTYWGSFAVIASISFLSLFFFSKVLMFLSERLDRWADHAAGWTSTKAGWRQRKQKRAMEAEEDI